MSCPSVAACMSATDTPGARSRSLKPSGVTSNTARLVTIFFTQPTPVRGREQRLRSLESPFLLVCIMATIILSAEATKSIAPPMPLTMTPGIFQLAISPFWATSIAPKMVRCTCLARIIPKLMAESKKAAPGRVVMVCFPALMRSASSAPSKGKGPIPKTPFSD